MPHRNARTTFHGRLLIVARYRAGWPKAHIAAAMGMLAIGLSLLALAIFGLLLLPWRRRW